MFRSFKDVAHAASAMAASAGVRDGKLTKKWRLEWQESGDEWLVLGSDSDWR